jgi:hypothetical protein
MDSEIGAGIAAIPEKIKNFAGSFLTRRGNSGI